MTATTSRRDDQYPAGGGLRQTLRSRLGPYLMTGRLPAAIITISCVILLYGFLFSGDFAVQELRINGVTYGDSLEVAAQAEVDGQSIFRVDAEQVAERIASLPYVLSADVQVKFPDRLVIDVVERQPVVVWQTADVSVVVDEFGVVLGEPQGGDLPTIHAQSLVPEPGDAVSASVVTAVQAIAEQIQGIERIDWSLEDGLFVTLRDGRTIDFGVAEQLPAKLTVYQALQEQLKDEWQTLDLTIPERPAYK